MARFLQQNWIALVFVGAMLAMLDVHSGHRRGHGGGMGGCGGGHTGHQGDDAATKTPTAGADRVGRDHETPRKETTP
ncbi:MAG: hypothetical protein ABI746_10930 [Dermatophilaceae bacterium]